MQNVLNFGQFVLPRAGAGTHFPADFARGGYHHRNKQQQRPAEVPAKANDEGEADHEGKELL